MKITGWGNCIYEIKILFCYIYLTRKGKEIEEFQQLMGIGWSLYTEGKIRNY